MDHIFKYPNVDLYWFLITQNKQSVNNLKGHLCFITITVHGVMKINAVIELNVSDEV